ncbi:aldehyde dehydrogenase [Murimonas intestini]|uniref:Aldehyde dehydrogenase n=1 Tax=Murimonas intestini TaxID=1337051 RepID=A0AB73T468_9FIRM|nr:aldehyde dehydrogenase [Murimonas intestini]MCR1841071.1 aldehyde dehydrogenase [Murimonas intestini]MCR1865811.1 aldehyde dehydrogenase [Murimonas intestini]MCR1883231.1 aldehyde dehydrogenase [Murimonas intestini]
MKAIEEIVREQQEFFKKGKTYSYEFRKEQLDKLRTSIKSHEQELLDALKKDLNKPAFEAYGTEIGLVLDELSFVRRHLKNWMKPERVHTSLVNFPSKSRIFKDPYGVALIMSPWNYPVLLTLDPLIGAIAAGNCAAVKPSNYSPNVSALIKKMLEEIYPAEYVSVIEGGREANQSLLSQKFDYIFFTGSVKVGKLVMESASHNLTPVSLELGGKSPCIVDETADLELAAKRIVWGKYINAGQTCVAPDYLLVHEKVKDELLEKIVFTIKKFYGPAPQASESFPKIVNMKHYERLMGLMGSGKVIIGGNGDAKRVQIAPTVLDEVSWDSPVMQEEIFGPILPVLTFSSMKEAMELVNDRPKPLACYYFTRKSERERSLLQKVSFGGGCINDTIMHLVSSHMPFGGVGNSGMGGYHGKDSFDTFSHRKSILKKSSLIDMPLRYPPYKDLYFKMMKMIMK